MISDMMKEFPALFEESMQEFIPTAGMRTPVIDEAMRYSLFAGGKRLRPMLMAAAYEALQKHGTPKAVHIAAVIATPEGIDVMKQAVNPENTTLWTAAIDPGMNEHKYIVPGFGDCGDLCYGEKL